MRRALAILKYVPAVLWGLLVVAWVVSWFIGFDVDIRRDKWLCGAGLHPGSLQFSLISSTVIVPGFCVVRFPPQLGAMGMMSLYKYDEDFWMGAIPLPFLLSLVGLIAIAPFTRFRFPVWSCFAWTALLAAELAYYLR